MASNPTGPLSHDFMMTLSVYEKDHSLKQFADFHGHDFIMNINLNTFFAKMTIP